MKTFLLYQDRDFDMEGKLPASEAALTQDLGLDTLFHAMAGRDAFLHEVARRAVLSSLSDPEAIRYRQHILQDCLDHPLVVRQIYDIAVEAIDAEKRVYRGFFSRYPETILHRSVEVLGLFVRILRKLRDIADEHGAGFRSEGFAEFFSMLTRELSDDYFQIVEDHLRQLRFRTGVLVSAELGQGGKGIRYVLRRPRQAKPGLLSRISAGSRSGYTLRISDRDENGLRTLADLRGRGINLAANALAQSADHILSFVTMLRCELGFYVGCLNLRDQLAGKGEPLCFPVPLNPGQPVLSCHGLYDVCLSLRLDTRAVGNDVEAGTASLVMVTGPNQGGKSTFLRSAGLAQLMMQCGMQVAADSFSANVCAGLFTHFKRAEDVAMNSGKLDEELSRMSEIADRIRPGSVVLFNESFAATNEREGSEVARQILRALLEAGVRVFFVTHLFDLAHGLYRQRADSALFLRAERQADGKRTFRLVEGEPRPTSYGQDLYERIFAAESRPAAPLPGGGPPGGSYPGREAPT